MGTFFAGGKRSAVIGEMVKKLAVQGENIAVVRRRNNIWWGVAIVTSLSICAVALLATGTIPVGRIAHRMQVMDDPLTKVMTAHNEHLISHDEYALLLDCMLVKYDSLPSHYKSERPFVKTPEVLKALSGIWVQLKSSTQEKILADIPLLKRNLEEADSTGMVR